MIVFRTVDISEFIELLLGKKLVGRTQMSCNCYEVTNNNEIIPMSELNKSCFCGFSKPLFYYNNKCENIMLKLNIPDEKTTSGYGDYYSSLYNRYIDGEEWAYQELNRYFKGMIKTRIEEIHFEEYDIFNVVSVYLPHTIKCSTELGYRELENNNPFNLGEFLHRYFRKLKMHCKKKYSLNYEPKYKDLDCLPFELSINVAKNIIKEELTNEVLLSCDLPIEENLRVVESFVFTSCRDFSATLDRPKTISYISRSIDCLELFNVLKDVKMVNSFSMKSGKKTLEIKDFPNFDENDKSFLNLYTEFLRYAEMDRDLLLYIRNEEQKIKNMIYAIYSDINIA